MAVNGRPKDDATFRHIMGYVQQFDAIQKEDTAVEAVRFAAALKLDNTVSADTREAWVSRYIYTLYIIYICRQMHIYAYI
jgi:ABC-type multidrug transport system ATPase subunit